MKAPVVVGILLTVMIAAVIWVIAGRQAAFAGAMFGVLATGINATAVAALKPAMDAAFRRFVERWAVGMGLRLLGAIIWLVAVLVDDVLFPPLASAAGYLGVLIPLLFAEMRFVR